VSANATYYPVLVDANNATLTTETLGTDAGFTYNPSTNLANIAGTILPLHHVEMTVSTSETYTTGTERVFASWSVLTNTGPGGVAFTTAANAITVIKTGRYSLSVILSWSANATGYRRLQLQQNGTNIHNNLVSPGTNLAMQQHLTLNDIALNANDVIGVSLIQNSGATLTVAGVLNNRFTMTYLGE
jgi:hypothetical protein